MEHKITVVGIGPGHPDYILPVALKAINSASVLVGSKRALDTYARDGQLTKCIDKQLDAVLEFIAEKNSLFPVVVMVSGDPGFYSMLIALREKFSEERLHVIPGISSAQFAFARLAQPWQDADLISLHGRKAIEADLHYAPGKKLGILTDHVYNSQNISEILLQTGWPSTTAVALCTNLSYASEKIVRTTLTAAKQITGFNHCVMVVGL